MPDLSKFNVTAIEAITTPFRNALYHRSTIVEGIRKIAVRNMVHLARAMVECGHTGSEGDKGGDWISEVQDKMLADQGMEIQEAARAMIGMATYLPLQVYLCLLYASIEFYENISKKLALYKDPEMDRYLTHQRDFIENLKYFRNAFLHPSRDSTSRELSFLKTDDLSYNRAPELQDAFDQYLARTRTKVQAEVRGKLKVLPQIQRLYCVWLFLGLNGDRMMEHRDEKGLEHCTTQLKKLAELRKKLAAETHTWAPNEREQEVGSRLARCLNDISPSGPEQTYTPPGQNQTPMPVHKSVLVTLATGATGSPVSLDINNRHEAHILNNRTFFGRLTGSLDVLFNEAMNNLQIGTTKPGTDPGEFEATILKRVQERGWQYEEEMVAPSRVLMALVYEPLRAYRAAADENPTMANDVLDLYLSVPGRLRRLRDFRNSVFHVIKNPSHPRLVDLAVAGLGHETLVNPMVFGQLRRVLGLVPPRGREDGPADPRDLQKVIPAAVRNVMVEETGQNKQ